MPSQVTKSDREKLHESQNAAIAAKTKESKKTTTTESKWSY